MARAMKNASIIFATSLLAAACVPDGKDMGEDNPLHRVCTAMLGVTGSFQESAPQPEEVKGCWPVGTWTFTASVIENECTTTPALEQQYQFLVERDADMVETYTYLNDPTYERALIKVTSGGGGLCEGGLEIYSLDGLVLVNLKPALQVDKSIDGFGEYDIYSKPVWR